MVETSIKVAVFITGGSGVGKSTLVANLADRLGGHVAVLHLEDYYVPDEDMPVDATGRPNEDAPESFDPSAYAIAIARWREDPASPPVALVEGFIAAHWSNLIRPEDRVVYLEAAHGLRFERRQGDHKDPYYESQVLIPMHNQYVAPQAAIAHRIIDVTNMTATEVADEMRILIDALTSGVRHASV